MGFFNTILKTTLHIATTPIDIVKDVVTLGGALTDEESALLNKVDKLLEDIDEISEQDEL